MESLYEQITIYISGIKDLLGYIPSQVSLLVLVVLAVAGVRFLTGRE